MLACAVAFIALQAGLPHGLAVAELGGAAVVLQRNSADPRADHVDKDDGTTVVPGSTTLIDWWFTPWTAFGYAFTIAARKGPSPTLIVSDLRLSARAPLTDRVRLFAHAGAASWSDLAFTKDQSFSPTGGLGLQVWAWDSVSFSRRFRVHVTIEGWATRAALTRSETQYVAEPTPTFARIEHRQDTTVFMVLAGIGFEHVPLDGSGH